MEEVLGRPAVQHAEVGAYFQKQAPSLWFRGQVEVVLGPASESIERLAARGVRFDLAFLDADKGGYLGYYQQARGGACPARP